MRCPTCDAWTTVSETREGEHGTTKRRRECANGHRFGSVEISSAAYAHVKPSLQRSFAAILTRIGRWKRDTQISLDPRPRQQVADEHGVSVSSIRKTCAARRRLAGE